jgi:hypothetical protein
VTPEEVEILADLDARGFIPGASENMAEFLQRVERIQNVHREFETALSEQSEVAVFDEFKVSQADLISPELMDEAARKTEELYGFTVRHVPGFYLRHGMGMFWGGCMLGDPESGFSVFMLRDVFRKKRQFLNYQRDELLAHELCHTARQSLNEFMLEEYFAYRTSGSALRRYLGNCFISDCDAWGFILPALLLPASELIKAWWNPDFPAWICWLIAAVYPVWLLCRNAWSRHLVNRAFRAVSAAGAGNPGAVLFRCTLGEIQKLGGMTGQEVLEMVRKKSADSPRWAVIARRFF